MKKLTLSEYVAIKAHEIAADYFKQADAGLEDDVLARMKRRWKIDSLQIEQGDRATILQSALQNEFSRQGRSQRFVGFESVASVKWQGKAHKVSLTFTP